VRFGSSDGAVMVELHLTHETANLLLNQKVCCVEKQDKQIPVFAIF